VDGAVRAHDARRQETVDRESVLPSDPSFAAAERQPRHARLRYHAARHDEAEGLGLAIEIAPKRAALRSRDARPRIDIDATHPRQIDDHPAIAARVAGHRVASTADGHEKPVRTGELDGVHHVGRPRAPHDQRRTVPMHRIVDGLVRVARVSRLQHVSADRRAELLESRIVDARSPTITCRHRSRH